MCLGVVQTLPRFFWIFWNLLSFSLSYFYLLDGSKIFFMSSKYFIWIVHTPIYLCEVSWIFCDFSSIFRAFKTISSFSEIVFGIKKINSKKTILTGRAQRPDPVRIARAGPASDPAAAHPGPSAPDGRRCTTVLGVRAQVLTVNSCIKVRLDL
jgi:hypothetical protein